MATTNEAIKILNNCNFSSTLNDYYSAEIHNHKDSPQDLGTVIDAMRLSVKACKNIAEAAAILPKYPAQISNLQQRIKGKHK